LILPNFYALLTRHIYQKLHCWFYNSKRSENFIAQKKLVKTFADLETGEVLNLYEGDKWKITTEEQRNTIQKSIKTKELNEDMKIWNNELGGFVFVLFKYCDKLLEQHNEIIPEDITKLFYLATYVDYEGYLIYEDTYMNRKIMMNVLGMTRNPFDKFYNKLIKLEIFIEDNKKKELFYKRWNR